jgi:hypothetical protein
VDAVDGCILHIDGCREGITVDGRRRAAVYGCAVVAPACEFVVDDSVGAVNDGAEVLDVGTNGECRNEDILRSPAVASLAPAHPAPLRSNDVVLESGGTSVGSRRPFGSEVESAV